MASMTQHATRFPRAGRDHRIDFVRGLALAMIFINHLPGNWLENWTSRNFGFSDASEIFVLLAGYAAALGFHESMMRGDMRAIAKRATWRAGELYMAHLITTLLAATLFVAFLKSTGRPDAFDLIGITPVLDNPLRNIGAIAAGGLQLSYFNILPMYVVLLLALPLMLWLAARDLRLLAAASAVCYGATNLFGASLPSCQDCEAWFFNPLAWQALFVCGLMFGLARSRELRIAYHPLAYAAALTYVGFAAVWTYGNYGNYLGAGILPPWVGSLHKSHLPLSRFIHVLALGYVVGHSPVWQRLAGLPKTMFLTRMGRHSLPVFMTGSVLSMAGWIILTETEGGFAVQTALVAAGIAAMAGLAVWLDARAEAGRAFAPVRGSDEALGNNLV